MQQTNSFEATYRASLRAAWDLDSVLQPAQELDFSRNFLPQSLARTGELSSLTIDEQRLLNQISAYEYLSLFIIVEEFILPFVMDHAREAAGEDRYGMRALLNFAGEEVKHMQLFRRFLDAFERGFPVGCEVIGPPEAIGQEVLRHHPLAVVPCRRGGPTTSSTSRSSCRQSLHPSRGSGTVSLLQISSALSASR